MNSNLELKSQLSLLQSADPVVRHNAIHAIGQVKDRRAMMALKDIVLYDSDLHCRKSALFWLQRSADQVIFNEALRHA